MDIDKLFDLENYYYYEVCFKELLGKTLKEIIVNKDCSEFKDEFILFRTTENEEFIIYDNDKQPYFVNTDPSENRQNIYRNDFVKL